MKRFQGEPYLIARGDQVMRIAEVSQEMSGKIAMFFPYFVEVEKSAQTHDPAIVTISKFTAPLAALGQPTLPGGPGNLIRAQGVIDPGTGRFVMDRSLRTALNFTGQRFEGEFGERFTDIRFTVGDGIVDVEEFVIPLGDIEIPVSSVTTFTTDPICTEAKLRPISGAIGNQITDQVDGPLGGLLDQTVKQVVGEAVTIPYKKCVGQQAETGP